MINLIHRYLLKNPSSIEAMTALNHCLKKSNRSTTSMTTDIIEPAADDTAKVSTVTKCREKNCDLTFSDASNARRHERQQHGFFDKELQKWYLKKFVCLLCPDKNFVSKGNFNLHEQNYHERKIKKKTPNFKESLIEVSAPEFVKKM